MADNTDTDMDDPLTNEKEIESEEAREARELKEKQEFIEAIRRSREEEERVHMQWLRGDEKDLEEAAAEAAAAAALGNKKSSSKHKGGADTMGRVFSGDGDVMDEFEIAADKRKGALEFLEEAKKGKLLKEIDHSKIEYMPFRKNLFIVPKSLAKLSEAQIAELREDLHIKVRGRGCVAPIANWEQCGLSDRILQTLEKLKLQAPFNIQKQAIPAIMCGRDIIGVAKTGSGKTLAFLLPMFRHIQDQPPLYDNEGPIGLIMAPARELAFQINQEAKRFTSTLGMRVACIYGGGGVADQIADLKRGSHIVVCTPGRMIDILCMQAGKMVTLRKVTMVVLDEADRCARFCFCLFCSYWL
jgi:ATP-dependent RNA helicase DDX46/PRP5